ncbi:MAG: hypothetical protein C0421_10275 [Hyphomonas sp.]|uniref:hypothetical protein n=1 Tax=Hyphomonas sp. TaxID=87 RepID=UPI0025B9DAA7|nr:hypothetical protein [Hyphomonas sp.]MBA4339221.1 hypothetical protein [Hyphomonas sp.]
MIAENVTSCFESEVAPSLLLARLGSIIRELEHTCNDFQEALSSSLQSDTFLTASLISRLQEIDRVSQTLGSIAAFTSALETAPSGEVINIGKALDHVRLHAVRDALRGLGVPYAESDVPTGAELF